MRVYRLIAVALMCFSCGSDDGPGYQEEKAQAREIHPGLQLVLPVQVPQGHDAAGAHLPVLRHSARSQVPPVHLLHARVCEERVGDQAEPEKGHSRVVAHGAQAHEGARGHEEAGVVAAGWRRWRRRWRRPGHGGQDGGIAGSSRNKIAQARTSIGRLFLKTLKRSRTI